MKELRSSVLGVHFLTAAALLVLPPTCSEAIGSNRPTAGGSHVVRVGGLTYEWKVSGHPQESYISVNGRDVFRGSSEGTEQLGQPLKEGVAGGCVTTVRGYPLSIVGTLVSIRRIDYEWCQGAGHGVTVAYGKVLRLEPDGKVVQVSLTDLFSRDEILSALYDDKYFVEHLKYLKGNELWLQHLFQGFGFHHLKNGKVATRVFVDDPDHPEFETTEIGIYLTPTADFLHALKLSDSAGLLMKDMDQDP